MSEGMEWSQLAALTTPPSKQSPAPVPGMSAGGGLLSSFRNGVGIRALSRDDVGIKFCGGVIGRGHKMCVVRSCGITKHKSEKAFLGGSDRAAVRCYIDAAGGNATAVFLEPSIPSERFGNALDRYLTVTRSTTEWELLFSQLELGGLDGGADNEAQFEKLEKNLREDNLEMARTPMKKRPKLDVRSPAVEVGYEATLAQIAEGFDPGDPDFAGSLNREWSNIKENVDRFKEMFDGIKLMVGELSDGMKDELELVDVQIASLSHRLGPRPPATGMMSAFKAIEDILKQLEGFRVISDGMDRFMRGDDRSQRVTDFRQAIYDEMIKKLTPVFQLYYTLSSHQSHPGDLLRTELDSIKVELQAIKTSGPGLAAAGPVPAPAAGVQWGMLNAPSFPPMASGAGAGNNVSGDVAALNSKITAMATRIGAIEQQLSSNAVNIGGYDFRSRVDTKSWLSLHAKDRGAYVFFMDAHAMLGLAYQELASTSDIVSFESGTAKAGYVSTEEAIVVTGFKLALPSFFGKESQANVATKDSRVLPAIKTASDWDTGDGFTGARVGYENALRAAGRDQTIAVQAYLPGVGGIVAQKCIDASVRFLEALGTWITKEYGELIGRGGSATECWRLISHCVRAVFDDLHEARAPGRGPFLPGDRAAGVVWGFLQAHRKMQEYLKKGFSASSTLSHVLNIHLRDHAVTSKKFEEFKLRMLEAVSTATAAASSAQSRADSAWAKCKNIKN